jgi:hypothetical protein
MKALLILSLLSLTACSTTNWRAASRASAGIAPKPEELKESIYQIYVARAFSWRGYFATHPWISWKKAIDPEYTVSQVTSWGLGRGGSALNTIKDVPDRFWYDHEPTLIFEVRGEVADKVIAQTEALIEKYPFKDTYTLWPGPNSNTYVDHIIRSIPELTVELPPHAIGKDYLVDSYFISKSPSGSGFQVSIFGLLGFTLGLAEGVEINILSLTFGVDFLRPAIKLPFVGRLGFKDAPL